MNNNSAKFVEEFQPEISANIGKIIKDYLNSAMGQVEAQLMIDWHSELKYLFRPTLFQDDSIFSEGRKSSTNPIKTYSKFQQLICDDWYTRD